MTLESQSVEEGNLSQSFLLKFRSVFDHISSAVQPIMLLWVSSAVADPDLQLRRGTAFKGLTMNVEVAMF